MIRGKYLIIPLDLLNPGINFLFLAPKNEDDDIYNNKTFHIFTQKVEL